MPLSTYELNVRVPVSVSRDLGLGLVVQLEPIQLVPLDMPQDSQHTCTQLEDVAKDLWEILLEQQMEPMQETQGHLKDTKHYGGKGVMTLPNTVKWIQ